MFMETIFITIHMITNDYSNNKRVNTVPSIYLPIWQYLTSTSCYYRCCKKRTRRTTTRGTRHRSELQRARMGKPELARAGTEILAWLEDPARAAS